MGGGSSGTDVWSTEGLEDRRNDESSTVTEAGRVGEGARAGADIYTGTGAAGAGGGDCGRTGETGAPGSEFEFRRMLEKAIGLCFLSFFLDGEKDGFSGAGLWDVENLVAKLSSEAIEGLLATAATGGSRLLWL